MWGGPRQYFQHEGTTHFNVKLDLFYFTSMVTYRSFVHHTQNSIVLYQADLQSYLAELVHGHWLVYYKDANIHTFSTFLHIVEYGLDSVAGNYPTILVVEGVPGPGAAPPTRKQEKSPQEVCYMSVYRQAQTATKEPLGLSSYGALEQQRGNVSISWHCQLQYWQRDTIKEGHSQPAWGNLNTKSFMVIT